MARAVPGNPVWRIAIGAVVACASAAHSQPAAPVAQQEVTESDGASLAVEAYLDRLGLTRLLAATLEDRLEALPRAKRQAIAERLGAVYVAMFKETKDDAERTRLETRARALLSAVPEAESIELRLSVNTAIYERAEGIAERARLRLVSVQEVTDVVQSLRTLGTAFAEIGVRAHRRVDQLERIEATGEMTDKGREELAEARRLRSLAYYYAGWSECYVAMLGTPEPFANEALKSFGWLLNSPGRAATLDRMPTSLLQYEHIGRAAIGCALAASARGSDGEAIKWLDVVEQSTDAPVSVREQVPARRMSVLGNAKRWGDLDRLVRNMRRAESKTSKPATKPLSAAIARLLAIITLEADRKVAGEQIEALARTAFGDLIAQKEIGQVLDLVSRYGTAPLGDTGFIAMYVRGVQEYELARKAHMGAGEAGEPTENAEARTRYESAGRLLEAADRQPDAEQFGRERVRAAVSRGLAKFYSGQFEAAAEVLSKAWVLSRDAASLPDAQETLWTCVLAWNRAVEAKKNDGSLVLRRDQAVALFLKTYPESANAPRLILMRAASGQLNDDDALKALSGVAKDSPVYEPAQRQIARILYSKFRTTLGAERDRAAMRFVEVAEELFQADAKIAIDPDGKERVGAAERAIGRARQMLDALLSGPNPDGVQAASVLKRLRSIAVIASIDLTAHVPELMLREVQIALVQNSEEQAIAAVESLSGLSDRGGQFGASAERLVYRRLAQKWTPATDEADVGKTGADLVKIGVRVIDRVGADGAAMREPGMIALQNTCASAATLAFKRSGDTAMRDLAVRLDRSLLVVEPTSEPALRRLAENSESAGESATALECWRLLLDGAASGTPAWFEAKYQTLRLLAPVDRERVRAALAQHISLYPEYGPEPWGEKLRDMERSIGGDGNSGGGEP